jgi:hypothetical protein
MLVTNKTLLKLVLGFEFGVEFGAPNFTTTTKVATINTIEAITAILFFKVLDLLAFNRNSRLPAISKPQPIYV